MNETPSSLPQLSAPAPLCTGMQTKDALRENATCELLTMKQDSPTNRHSQEARRKPGRDCAGLFVGAGHGSWFGRARGNGFYYRR
jgi:hypothetical protein